MRIGFQTNEESLLRKFMLSELPIQSRKWRKFAQFVVKTPELTEEQKTLQADQKKRIEAGETIPETELIVDPEAYEERELKILEFESEGAAFEEFLLSLGDYTDVAKAKTEKWKQMISVFVKQITNGEEVVEKEKEKLSSNVEFWEGVKVNNPV